jgi:Tfp pilus assembly protein PilO
MSDQSPVTRPRKGARIRASIQSFNSSRGQRVLGSAEIVGLAGSLLILLLVIVSYFYLLLPTRLRVNALEAERAALQTRLRNSQFVVSQERTTEARVQDITESLDYFESKKLIGANLGRMGLYDTLNLLIRKNGLRNTSGPTYTPLEATSSKPGAGGMRSANTKWQSVYPGIAISVTVEGQYQNLRRFIQDMETSKPFVIINSVELERSTEANNSPLVEGAPSTAPRDALVSLRLEMATYFQRDAAANAAVNAVAH